ncbi:hypothetical protein PVAR5_7865 [Paecilomyces variotii No. 5]|uniref:Uncharacterized protein n=1 Tax=Byssochlamys spectabilis (strain No. 5 / NBRC 109023) TaxID=1356009 RepID=V5G401_BYSSN|nr:hypothetical protein PVAR5_7865 [Paecilomyces variotii No. 5]
MVTNILSPTPTLQPAPTPSATGPSSANSSSSSAVRVILNLLSYAPISLYAENLRMMSALIRSICGRVCIQSPVTGCIKDLMVLWNMRPQDVFEYPTFGQSIRQVVSLRHGNTFLLVNSAVLDQAGFTGRGVVPPGPQLTSAANPDAKRPTVLNITFLVPRREGLSIPRCAHWPTYVITAGEIAILTLIAAILAAEGFYLGTILLTCLIANTALLSALQECSQPIIANQSSIKHDTKAMVAGGAALDVHIIATNWNTSELDVLVGYSSQLHALTNIPMRMDSPRLLRWIARLLAVCLVIQAAILTALAGGNGDDNDHSRNQGWATVVWLVFYLLLWVPPRLFKAQLDDSILDTQPVSLRRLPSITCNGRRDALSFIAALPASLRTGVGRWDWADVFIPPNARRKEWELTTHQALMRIRDGTVKNDISSASRPVAPAINEKTVALEERILKHIRVTLEEPFLKKALGESEKQTRLHR